MVIFLTFGALKIIKILNHHKVDMKKIILVVAIAGVAASCQKIQAGGNKAVLKMEPGVERYSDDVMSDEATAAVNAADAQKSAAMKAADSSRVVTQPAVIKTDSAKAAQLPASSPAN
jgi:hypothetical protein